MFGISIAPSIGRVCLTAFLKKTRLEILFFLSFFIFKRYFVNNCLFSKILLLDTLSIYFNRNLEHL